MLMQLEQKACVASSLSSTGIFAVHGVAALVVRTLPSPSVYRFPAAHLNSCY